MKESVLSVLVYLFQNYFLGEPDTVHDRDSLQSELIDAGFDALHVGKAFDWLADLQDDTGSAPNLAPSQPLRVFAPEELDLLDADCRGFLLALEQRGVLDADARETQAVRAALTASSRSHRSSGPRSAARARAAPATGRRYRPARPVRRVVQLTSRIASR